MENSQQRSNKFWDYVKKIGKSFSDNKYLLGIIFGGAFSLIGLTASTLFGFALFALFGGTITAPVIGSLVAGITALAPPVAIAVAAIVSLTTIASLIFTAYNIWKLNKTKQKNKGYQAILRASSENSKDEQSEHENDKNNDKGNDGKGNKNGENELGNDKNDAESVQEEESEYEGNENLDSSGKNTDIKRPDEANENENEAKKDALDQILNELEGLKKDLEENSGNDRESQEKYETIKNILDRMIQHVGECKNTLAVDCNATLNVQPVWRVKNEINTQLKQMGKTDRIVSKLCGILERVNKIMSEDEVQPPQEETQELLPEQGQDTL